MRNQLLCTFTDKRYIINTIRDILVSYKVNNNKIFIYELTAQSGQCLCSYNIKNARKKFLNHTISVHRKKQSNTFYTINALNALIMDINNGILDVNFSVDWDNYRDMIILINDNILNKQNIKFKEVYYIKPVELDDE